MKSKIITLFSLCLLASVTLFLDSCSKDKDASPIVLVVVERNSGKLFIVDATTGAKTEVATITSPTGGTLTNIRGMIYHSPTNKIFASTTTSGGGIIYEIDINSLSASIINLNADDHWYGVTDLVMTADNKILASLYFKSSSSVGYGPGLLTLNTNGTISNSVRFSNEDLLGGMGLTYGSNSNELLISNSGLEIYKSTLSGTTTLVDSLVPDGFDSEDPYDYSIQNMVKDSKGTIYSTVYGYEDGNTYLAKVDLSAKKLIKIGMLGEGSSNRYHGLMLIPKNKV
ncbi:MAG: hypothetical protein KF725_06120 [Cyclobacteriaceae bacterium]|nr:hypothetical protein [Cyclobacteriaceae bacterium]UYN85170.1 MAG: hypothetical protein KIT51_09690 [Cyclobacteriaceae bacterium]